MQSRKASKKESFLVECVPNISVGRDKNLLGRLINSIELGAGVKLLHVDSGYAANRTVLTFVGPVNQLLKTITRLYEISVSHIDMRFHEGNHPFLGALDVCPFIAFDKKNKAMLMAEVLKFSEVISQHLSIPVYLYAESSEEGRRKSLSEIRKGGYKRLINDPEKMSFVPDYGKEFINLRFGATVIGVRDFMLAYNINLSTKDLRIAKKIAKEMRTIRDAGQRSGGYLKSCRDSLEMIGLSPKKGRINAKNMKPLQILAWYIEEYDCCQISTNIYNPRELSLLDIYQFADEISAQYGIRATTSELIGMMPLFAMEMVKKQLSTSEDNKVIDALGLNFNKAIQSDEIIIERAYLGNEVV